jgi:hypothetical protein
MSNYGPDKPCKRDACADEPAHLGGEHIDQRSPRYDGPSITINALNSGPRKAAYALLAAGAPMPEVVDLVQEIHRLGRQVAAVMVDKDRSVRAASERALDCADHGHLIKFAEESRHHFAEQAESNDRARVALVSVLYALKDAVSVLRDRAQREGELPPAAEIVESIAGYLDKASRSHDSAWRRAETKARKAKAGAQ